MEVEHHHLRARNYSGIVVLGCPWIETNHPLNPVDLVPPQIQDFLNSCAGFVGEENWGTLMFRQSIEDHPKLVLLDKAGTWRRFLEHRDRGMRHLCEVVSTLQDRKASVDGCVRETLLTLALGIDKILDVLLRERFGQRLAKPRTKVPFVLVSGEFNVVPVQTVVVQAAIEQLAHGGLSWPFQPRHGLGKPQLGFFLVAGEGGVPDLFSTFLVRQRPDRRIGPSIQSDVIYCITFGKNRPLNYWKD